MSMSLQQEPRTTVSRRTTHAQFLTFKLDDQEYALAIANVVQVVRMVALSRLPQAPEGVEGVINLRGQVIPVINLRKRCGLPAQPYTVNSQLLIAQSHGRSMALIVDVVSEVLALPATQIEAPERVAPQLQQLCGVGKVGNRLILILNPDSLWPVVPVAAPAAARPNFLEQIQ